jgi:hypothetical protein
MGVVQVMSHTPNGPRRRGGERLGAGHRVSHAIGEGEAKGHYLSGFDRSRIGLHSRNGAGRSVTKASKGGEYAMR